MILRDVIVVISPKVVRVCVCVVVIYNCVRFVTIGVNYVSSKCLRACYWPQEESIISLGRHKSKESYMT